MFTKRRVIQLLIVLLLGVVWVKPATTARAHPADMYYHVLRFDLAADGVALDWSITPGTLLAVVVWNDADEDGSGDINPTEAQRWTGRNLFSAFTATVDDEPLAWRLEGVDWPDSLPDFEVGEQQIVVHMAADWPGRAGGESRFVFYNRYQESTSVNWFYVSGADGLVFRTPEQHNGLLELDFARAGESGSDWRVTWSSGTPSLEEAADAPPPRPTSASSTLSKLVRSDDLSPSFYLAALAIALGLGALHALTPGHGKALVGAYLVGARGTARHAVALGGIVTLTHTGSVLTLGVITLVASRFIMPTTLFPLLEVASGLLVVGMGIGLLGRRWRGFRSVEIARRRRETPQPVAPTSPPSARSTTLTINQPIQVNVYDSVLPGGTSSAGVVQWRSLVALGISGGLVPCPDAIAILLVAVAINRIFLGLSLIVAFSLGLAVILTAIGIALVRSRRLLEGMNSFGRVVPALPMFSAIVVIGLGLGLTANALRKTDLGKSAAAQKADVVIAENGQVVDQLAEESPAAPFRLDDARVLYMDLDDGGQYQLFVSSVADPRPQPITDLPFGVWDYALAPDGASIAYSAPREFGWSDIWTIDTDGTNRRLIVPCEEADCSRPVWSPDGARIVYERRASPTPADPLGLPALWWLDLASGEMQPVFQDSSLPSLDPRWSPDGQWLSYASSGSADVQIFNLDDGTNRTLLSRTGRSVIWSPDSAALLVTDIAQRGDQTTTHLLRYDLDTAQVTDLTGEGNIGDTWAAWSPDGAWIAVVRRGFSGSQTSRGDTIWLLRADGSDARPLTTDPDVLHGLPVWSPDGRYVIYQRHDLTGTLTEPEIWLLDVETGTAQPVGLTGNWPVWLG